MKWGAAVIFLAIAELIIDRSRFDRLVDGVLALRDAGLLTEWEEGFVYPLPPEMEPTPRQASKWLQIWDERRPRYESDGVLVRNILQQLLDIRLELDEDDEAYICELFARGSEFLQLDDINRVAWIAHRHELFFQPVKRRRYVMSDSEALDVEELVSELRADAKPRRARKRVRRAPPARGLRHRAADLSGLRDALDRLGAAVAADCAAKAVRV